MSSTESVTCAPNETFAKARFRWRDAARTHVGRSCANSLALLFVPRASLSFSHVFTCFHVYFMPFSRSRHWYFFAHRVTSMRCIAKRRRRRSPRSLAPFISGQRLLSLLRRPVAVRCIPVSSSLNSHRRYTLRESARNSVSLGWALVLRGRAREAERRGQGSVNVASPS